MHNRLKDEDRQVTELDLGENPDKLRGEYVDMYEGVQSEVLSTTRFDENSDLSITYLSRIDMARAGKIKSEKMYPTSEQGYNVSSVNGKCKCKFTQTTPIF